MVPLREYCRGSINRRLTCRLGTFMFGLVATPTRSHTISITEQQKQQQQQVIQAAAARPPNASFELEKHRPRIVQQQRYVQQQQTSHMHRLVYTGGTPCVLCSPSSTCDTPRTQSQPHPEGDTFSKHFVRTSKPNPVTARGWRANHSKFPIFRYFDVSKLAILEVSELSTRHKNTTCQARQI